MLMVGCLCIKSVFTCLVLAKYSPFSVSIVSAALKKVHVLMNIAHGIVRLDNVWGICGGIRPVKYLVRQVR